MKEFETVGKTKKVVFSQRLAIYLVQHGELLICLGADNHDPTKAVYIFNQSERLHQLIDEYVATKNKKNDQ